MLESQKLVGTHATHAVVVPMIAAESCVYCVATLSVASPDIAPHK